MQTADSGAEWWSSDRIPAADRTDAWLQTLRSSYRSWDVPGRVSEEFSARLRRVAFSGAGLVECVCTPCEGTRGPAQLRQDDEPYLGLQIVLSGSERFRAGEDTLSVQAGDALIWRSDRQLEFEVTKRLHKITFMVPMQTIRESLPRDTVIRPGLIDARRGVGALLFGQLSQLCATDLHSFCPIQAHAVRRSLQELMASAILSRQDGTGAATGLSDQYLRNVQAYLLDHLRDENLRLSDAAKANRISLRYLHMLFLRTGQSASAWVQEQRLMGCRADLDNPAFRTSTVAEIGWCWGFRDASQFSRAFRARFGVSPGEFRRSRSH